MTRVKFRFNAPVFAMGAAALSISTGVARLVPDLVWASVVLFMGGLVLLVAGTMKLHPADIVVHKNWDMARITESLRRAPDDAVVRILQTWFPEEAFIPALRYLYLQDQKEFVLDVLLIDPATKDGLLGSRVMLRNLTPEDAAKEVTNTVSGLRDMKSQVEKARSEARPGARRTKGVDLEIRVYKFMPFGPIYQIGEEVMYVGFFINFGTSSEAPMLEIRNTPHNRLWALFRHHYDEGWSDVNTKSVWPVPTDKA